MSRAGLRDVFFLSCGGFVTPARAIRPPGEGARWSPPGRMSNTVGVAVRDDGEILLVDAGWSQATCADPHRAIGPVHARTLGVSVEPADAVALQLRALGLDPGRVGAIVATHLHLDHIEGARDFPNAELIVTQRELEAHREWPRRLGYRAADIAHARVRAVPLDGGPTYGFPASHDVLGDGRVVMLDARGHTAGSVAVALRGARTYVHAGDAVYQRWEYGLSPAGPCLSARLTAWKRDEQRRTYGALRSCEADPRAPVVVPSHDAEVFAQLPHEPAAGAPQ